MTRYYWMGGNRSYEQDRFFEQSLDKSQWQKAESAEKWDACWYTGMPDQNDFSEVGPERKINHIPGNNALTVKSCLYRSLMDLRERAERQDKGSGHLTDRLAFVPGVFSMPEDYHAFQQAALDDPGKRWILKPKNAARGKGIQLVGDPADVPLESSWMVQEYLENPHTMHGRKYVLRLYVLVSSVSPFRVYLYQQGFAKLASAPYNEENANNPYSYLTNPDVNALNLDAEVPVEFVDFDRYREWLREQGHDDKALFAKIEDLVALTCLAALEPMRERSRVVGADTRGCYELMGIDCLVDEKLKPWVLECNLSPSLEVCAGPESGGGIEEGIKGSLVADMVEIVGLNSKRVALETGSVDERLVRESQDEIARSGGFKNLVPGADPAAYLPFMALPRLSDWVVAQALSDHALQQPRLERWVAEDTLSEDQVYLYDTRLGHLSGLNETASLIWLMATDGAGPDDIAATLYESASRSMPAAPDAWAIRNDVWNTLGDWVNNRFLIQSGASANQPAAPATSPSPEPSPFSAVLDCGRFRVRLFTDSAPLIGRIEALLEPMAVAGVAGTELLPRLEIVRDTPGFTLILEGRVLRSRLPLSGVASALMACLATHAAEAQEIAIDAGLIAGPTLAGQAFLVGNSEPAVHDALALALSACLKADHSRGALLPSGTDDQISALGMPLQVSEGLSESFFGDQGISGPLSPTPGRGCLVPASSAVTGRRYTVSAVLIPSMARLREEDGLRAIPVNETLRQLISGCCSAGGQPLDTHGFTRLAEWLETCDRYLVDMNNIEVAAAALDKRCSTAPPQKSGSL
jgi:hypothetical protein